MKRIKFLLTIIFLISLIGCAFTAQPSQTCRLNETVCGVDVLQKVFVNLELKSNDTISLLDVLRSQAMERRGMNTLLEIKRCAQKAGLETKALKSDLTGLKKLVKEGQLVANITGNRHFCLIKDINDKEVNLYIPGLSHPDTCISLSEFVEFWDKTVLLLSDKPINLKKFAKSFKQVSDAELDEIFGGGGCDNTSGGGLSYTGAGGSDIVSTGNGAQKTGSGGNDAASDEPVVIRSGNLFLENNDINIPTRGLPLNLKRHYNAQVVSEVSGWYPEAGAGSWAIENGELSGQGDRFLSKTLFTDFTMELDMQTIQPGSSYAWETAWINFRYTEKTTDVRKAQDCYYFVMNANGNLELDKWQDGIQYWLVNTPSSYRPTNKNRIKIITQGANIKIYINGSLAINYTDPNPMLKEGKIALQSYFSHCHFDNLSISSGGNNYLYDFNTDDNDFIFGYGWTHSYSLKIKEYQTHLTLYRDNNYKEVYVPQGDGIYLPFPANTYCQITKDASGFSLRTKYRVHYRFDLTGKLIYVEDRNLNRTNLAYSVINGKTLLTSITEPAGRKITLDYGTNNMVAKATDPQGNLIQYFYDSAGHLTKVIDANGNVTNYSYDPITHNLIQLTDPEGNIFTYTYTYNDRIKTQTDPLGDVTTFDYLWTTTHVANSRGQIYKYNFDANLFLQSVTDPNNVVERTVNDPDGNVLEYYDKRGAKTTFTYDEYGNKTNVTNALGKITRYIYKLYIMSIGFGFGNGSITYSSYDAPYSKPLCIIDAKGNGTSFIYDLQDNLLQTGNAELAVTIYTNNSYGQPLTKKDAKGNITNFTYDTYGNLSSVVDAQNNTTSYSYDVLGRLIKVTASNGAITEYTYDKNGNILTLKDALGNITTYTYTQLDKLASIKDPLGNITSYTYDCFGNVLTITDALGNVTAYTYDTADQMHFNKANLLSVTDAKNNKTTYLYNSLDRLIKQTDPAGKFYQFSYDNQGNLTSKVDANGKTISYLYDSLNRLYRINYPDSAFVLYTFDELGNITQMQDVSGITKYTFDKISRLKTLTYPDATLLSYTYDPNNNRSTFNITGYGQVTYTYDTLDRLIRIALPDGKLSQLNYDTLSRRTQTSYPNGALSIYSYDNANRLVQLINKDKALAEISKFTYTYDKASRKTAAAMKNGTVYYSYDKASQLLGESGSVDSKIIANSYSYDAVGNRLTSSEDALAATYTSNNLNQITAANEYAKKLIQVKGTVSGNTPVTVKVNGYSAAVASGQFTLDNLQLTTGANIINAVVTDPSNNTASSQVSVTYNAPVVLSTYSYDGNGNLITKVVGTNTENYTYDFENRLKAYSATGKTASYVYNGMGQRVSKTVNGTISKYYYDGDELVLEKNASGSIYYIHGPRIDEIISDSKGNCYQADGLGSVTNLTNTTGVMTDSYNYKPYGGIRSQTGTTVNPWLYTGRQLDSETGLYNYRNRYYNPALGRFSTRDPIGISGGINLYAYVTNNPINFIDPWGLEPKGPGDNKNNNIINDPKRGDWPDEEGLQPPPFLLNPDTWIGGIVGAGPRGWLFGRGVGILNINDYIRIGWSWKGTARTGKEIFRIAIGNKKLPIHWHFP